MIVQQLPSGCAAKLSGGHVFCLGPAEGSAGGSSSSSNGLTADEYDPADVVAAALAAAAAAAPQLPLLHYVPAPALLQCLAHDHLTAASCLTQYGRSSSSSSSALSWSVSLFQVTTERLNG